MNIVYDDGLTLDGSYRVALAPILPMENAPLRLSSATSKTDGTPRCDEGFVFLTHLPVDVLKYHSDFFKAHNNAPQWFFILLNRNDHGTTDLKNAARKYNLKNCTIFHVKDAAALEMAIKEIDGTRRITKGKALLLSKHKKSWTADLAKLLFGEDKNKYAIMDLVSMNEMDSEILLLCGEKTSDFKGIALPDDMEPYFVFKLKEELQQYLNSNSLMEELGEHYHMSTERVKARLYFVDIESESWLSNSNRGYGKDAVSDGILLWDRFGLPVSRSEYNKKNIEAVAFEFHESMIKMKELLF